MFGQIEIVISLVGIYLDLYDLSELCSVNKHMYSIRKKIYASLYSHEITRRSDTESITKYCTGLAEVRMELILDSDVRDCSFLSKLPLKKLIFIDSFKMIKSRGILLKVTDLQLFSLGSLDLFVCPNLKRLTYKEGMYEELQSLTSMNLEEINGSAFDYDEMYEELIPKLPFNSLCIDRHQMIPICALTNIKHLSLHRADNLTPLSCLSLVSLELINSVDLNVFKGMPLERLSLMNYLPANLAIPELDFPTLKHLVLNGVSLDFRNLAKLRIKTLKIANSTFTTNLLEYTRLPLESLEIENCVYAGGIDLRYLRPPLKELTIRQCRITSDDIRCLPDSLKKFTCVVAPTRDPPKLEFTARCQLEELSLADHELDIASFRRLAMMPLKKLYIVAGNLTDHHMSYLSKLELIDLNVSDNYITSRSLKYIKDMPLRKFECNTIQLIDVVKMIKC